jgi:diguanylate cyclase (GGDEF)-like protein
MLSRLRAGDTVARIGGDEFLVLLTGPASADDVLRVGHKMLQALGEPIGFGGGTVNPRASIGAAFVDEPGSLAEDLIRTADAAMYEAKRAGGQQVVLAATLAPGDTD